MHTEDQDAGYVAQLEKDLARTWPCNRKAKEQTQRRRQDLTTCFADLGSPDTSLVVFGSVARQEVTSGSDLDWILLIDGQSVPEHKDQERKIERQLVEGKYIQPGSSGVFGRMVGSHDLFTTLAVRTTRTPTQRGGSCSCWSRIQWVLARLTTASGSRFWDAISAMTGA